MLDNVKSPNKIMLIDRDKITANDDKNAKLSKSLFWNIQKCLKILEFKDTDFLETYNS